MNMAPNTNAIVKLAAEKSEKARERVVAAIKNLQARGDVVNFQSVAKEANVSKTFLYDPKHEDLAQRIRRLREQPLGVKRPIETPNKSQTAKDAQLVRLKERIAHLESEVRRLQLENELLYGRLVIQK